MSATRAQAHPQPAQSEPDQSYLRPSNRLMIAVVLALTFAAYIGTIRYQFVYDDRNQIVENSFIKSWRNVPAYFTGQAWQTIYPDMPGNYYRPAFLLWLLANYTLFGANASLWHLMAVVAHVSVTMLIYLLARRLLKDEAAALIAALIFGLHPARIEAVAWVSGATEPLLALLLIPSLLFYLNWRDRNNESSDDSSKQTKWLAASLGMFVLAMLAKETALVLPLIVFVYEWIFGAREGRLRTSLKRAAPYFALALVYFAARAIALKGLGHTVTPLPPVTVLMTMPSVLWFYIKLLLWPAGLSAFYDTPYVTSPGLSNFVLPCVAIAVVAVLLRAWGRRRKEIAFASALLALPILPLLNLPVFLEGEIAHDRYLYLPSIGFSIIVALALRQIRFSPAKLFGQPAFQVLAVAALAA